MLYSQLDSQVDICKGLSALLMIFQTMFVV